MLALLLGCATSASFAQTYPAKPIRFVSPYPPGGPNDIIARIVAQRMSLAFGQQWIVDNRAGRGGNIGTDLVAKSAPDGYTLVPVCANVT
jgi:tripartite-type tricarboxylate transporter receptor subunit TctC